MNKVIRILGKILISAGTGIFSALVVSKFKEGRRRGLAMKRDLEINNSSLRKEV